LRFEKWIAYHKHPKKKTTREELKRFGHMRRVVKTWRCFVNREKIRKYYSVQMQAMYRMFKS
jgi:hypothetical protein